jgi:hypothetical protein
MRCSIGLKTIIAQKSEIARLKKALRVFLAEAEGSEDEDDSSSDSETTSSDSDEDVKKEEGEEGEDFDDSDDSLPTPIYIILNESWHDDHTPRCVECQGEVVEGHCAYCDKEHAWDPVRPFPPYLRYVQSHIGSAEAVPSIALHGVPCNQHFQESRATKHHAITAQVQNQVSSTSQRLHPPHGRVHSAPPTRRHPPHVRDVPSRIHERRWNLRLGRPEAI